MGENIMKKIGKILISVGVVYWCLLIIAVLSGCTNVTNIERDRWSWDTLVKTYNLDEPLGARDY